MRRQSKRPLKQKIGLGKRKRGTDLPLPAILTGNHTSIVSEGSSLATLAFWLLRKVPCQEHGKPHGYLPQLQSASQLPELYGYGLESWCQLTIRSPTSLQSQVSHFLKYLVQPPYLLEGKMLRSQTIEKPDRLATSYRCKPSYQDNQNPTRNIPSH